MSIVAYPATADQCCALGNSLFENGHYLDAQMLFDRACALAPDSAACREARERLLTMAFGFGKKGGNVSSWFENERATECCGNGCECCCEGCGEGCAEGCCESLCDNCDCDCG